MAIRPYNYVGRITAAQVIAAAPADLIFNSVVEEGPGAGQFAYNNATGIWTLAPGYVYRLRAAAQFIFTTPGVGALIFSWVDSANALLAAAGGSASVVASDNALTNSEAEEAYLLFRPAASTQVKLRVTALLGGPANLQLTGLNGGFASVEQIQ